MICVILILVCLGLSTIGFIGTILSSRQSTSIIPKEIALGLFGFLWFLSFILGVGLWRERFVDNPIKIEEFHAVEQSIEQARSGWGISELELVKLQEKIIEKNEWLAKEQKKAKMVLYNWLYPDEILELSPIK